MNDINGQLISVLKRLLLESVNFTSIQQFRDLLLDIETLIDNYETNKG